MVVNSFIFSSDMKKFSIYIVIFLGLFLLLDICIGYACDYIFRNFKESTIAYDRYIFQYNDHPSEIFITGASKSTHHYIPSIIEDSLGMTCYNGGQDGQNVGYQYLAIEKAFQNGPIKCVILDLSAAQLGEEWSSRVDYQKVFYKDNTSAKKYVDEVMGNKAPVMKINSVRYNSRLIDVAGGIMLGQYSDKGYVELPYTGDEVKLSVNETTEQSNFVPSPLSLSYLDKIVDMCSDNNCRLILCYSPAVVEDESFTSFLENYCTEKNVPFWNYCSWEVTMSDRTCFKDGVHMNSKGALLYTNEICSRLKALSYCN